MKFKPCIDLHEGQVKQIVGSTLSENDNEKPLENFVSSLNAADYARYVGTYVLSFFPYRTCLIVVFILYCLSIHRMYQRDNLPGGHIIMLGKNCEDPTFSALQTYPGGMHVGGGINSDNALRYLQAGASHVIVTSYVFNEGSIDLDRLRQLSDLVGKERLVIDLSCRRLPSDPSGTFFVVTNKWTKYTSFPVT